jgi:transposase-like protein
MLKGIQVASCVLTQKVGSWVRIMREEAIYPGLKPRERYSRTQKIAAVEHYLTHGGCLSYTRRAIGYPSNEILKRWIEEFYPNARPWSFAQAAQMLRPEEVSGRPGAL